MNSLPEFVTGGHGSLIGTEGELVSICIAVEPRLLEGLLEALADLPFPVNPEIHHGVCGVPGVPEAATVVEFPAYAGRLPEIERSLMRRGFDSASVRAESMLEQIRGRGYNTYWKNARPYHARDTV